MKTKKRLEDYSWDELLEATSTTETLRENGRASAKYTIENKLGIHTDNEELKREWASMGGEASIEQLLQWQEENGHNIGEISKNKNDEWKEKIGIGNKGKVRTEDTKNTIRNSINELNKSLTKEQRSKIYSNDARKNAATKRKIEILKSIKKKQFTSMELKDACINFEYDYKLMIKDTNLLERIHTGKNKTDLSIYKKK